MNWNKLSMAEKAAIMKVAIEDGIYDLDTIRRGYNSFAEDKENTDSRYYSTMEKVAEENYKKWGFSTPEEALTHALNDNTYNYRGYYDKYPTSEANADTHWTDEFKTVYHPTFSDESIYSGNVSDYNPQGLTGGHWKGETFIPAPWQREHNYASGGSIHIKPSHRGRLTELKARTGKSEDELYNDGNPAHKKMVVFARNARKWKHADGGLLNTANTFAGGGKKKKSGALGNQAFQNYLSQALQEDNTFNTPGGIKFLTDIAYAESRNNPYATHNSGASGIFQTMPGNTSKGAYGNPMQQFRDMFRLTKSNLNYLKKHLTKKDWDRAAELGIDEYGLLAGAHLGGVGGVVNALRGIKNAKDSNGTSVMSYMTRFSQNGKPALGNDITANPIVMGTTPETTFTPEQYQLIYGDNPYALPTASYAEETPIWPNPYGEAVVEEPSIKTVELSPVDFTQQNANNQRRRNLDVLGYVLGSSKSNRRNGSLYNTIQMISDEDSFNPLRLLRVGDFGTPNSFAEGGNKKTAKQGNTYNSGSSSKGNHSQQMNQPNIFRRNGKYFYQESPDSEEITVTPVNTLFDDPALWTYIDKEGRKYTPKHPPVNNPGEIKQGESPSFLDEIVNASNNYYNHPILGAPARWQASWSNDTNPIKALWNSPFVFANPYVFGAKTISNLASEEGIPKTIRLFNNSNGSLADKQAWQRSLIGDLVEATMLFPAINEAYSGAKKLYGPWTYKIPENPNMAYRRMGPLERDWLMEGNELSTRSTNVLTKAEEDAARTKGRFNIFKAGAEHGGRKQFAKGQPWKGTTVTHGEEQVLAIPGKDLPWVSGKHYKGPQGSGFGIGKLSFNEVPFGSHIDLMTNEAGFSGINPSYLEGSIIYQPFHIFGHKFGYKKLYPRLQKN